METKIAAIITYTSIDSYTREPISLENHLLEEVSENFLIDRMLEIIENFQPSIVKGSIRKILEEKKKFEIKKNFKTIFLINLRISSINVPAIA